MRHAHRWAPIALLILAVLLCGCSKKEAQITHSQAQTTQTTAPAETVKEKDVTLGRVEGNVYTNTYAGFGCRLDSNWVFSSAEELQELPQNVQELLKDTEAGESIAEVSQIMDMKAENANDLTTINVLYSKQDAKSRLLYALMSEEDIIDSVLEQKDMFISSYAQAGIEVESIEKVEVDFLGETHFAIHTSTTWEGIPYYTLQLFDYHTGAYAITITFASYLEDVTVDLLDLFYKVD